MVGLRSIVGGCEICEIRPYPFPRHPQPIQTTKTAQSASISHTRHGVHCYTLVCGLSRVLCHTTFLFHSNTWLARLRISIRSCSLLPASFARFHVVCAAYNLHTRTSVRHTHTHTTAHIAHQHARHEHTPTAWPNTGRNRLKMDDSYYSYSVDADEAGYSYSYYTYSSRCVAVRLRLWFIRVHVRACVGVGGLNSALVYAWGC